jgi:hypothetical protein
MEPLPCNNRRDTYVDTQTDLRDYAAEMGSVGIIYIQSFLIIGSNIQKLIGGNSQTHRMQITSLI